jgi:hypothetical protein
MMERPPRYAGKIWGPGPPGRRQPSRIQFKREIPGRIVFFAGALLFIIFYMQILSVTPGHRSAIAGDAATVGSATPAAPVDSQAAPRPFQGLLDAAVDGAPLESLETTRESDPYRTLMWNLKRYDAAEVSSLAETVDAKQLLAQPERYRGCFVRVTGLLIQPPEMKRLSQNLAGYEYRWRGFLYDEPNAIVFDLFEKPDHEFDRNDYVVVEGIFLQLASYDARRGTEKVPFIEAKSLKVFVGERTASLSQNPTTLLLAAAVIMALLPVVSYFIQSFLQRKHEAELVAALEKARSRRPPVLSKKNRPAEAPPAAQAPAPEVKSAPGGAGGVEPPHAAPGEAGGAAAPGEAGGVEPPHAAPTSPPSEAPPAAPPPGSA